jgi:hypothetical protein
MSSEPKGQKVTRLSPIRRDQLLNRLNGQHFQSIPLLICLRHRAHGHVIRVQAQPQMTLDEHATATWVKDSAFPSTLNTFELASIILASSRRAFEFKPERHWIDEEAIRFTVPERAEEFLARKHLRYDCHEQNLTITVAQNTLAFCGRLLDYSVAGILVELTANDRQSLAWVNPTVPAQLTIEREGVPVYSGQTTISEKPDPSRFLLIPSRQPAPRFRPKPFRARRLKFTPSPDLVFTHPVTGRRHTLKVHDLGSLGFSVEEQASTAVLLPGLQITNAVLSFANSLCLSCTVQVVYSRLTEEDPREILRCGLAILHLSLQDHLKLTSLIQQAQDSRAYVNNQIDPEDLFEFFFETGFLYPHKYAEIAGNRDHFRKAYDKLYQQGAEIGRHFVYQDSGQILGHFATLRVYRQTWMNHHHAALNSHRAGLRVVRAISEYINESYLLNPANISYIIGYYQATNRFPQHYFGEFVQSVNDPSKTSLDTLSYLNDAASFGYDPGELAGDWALERANAADIIEFRGFYTKVSGGLLPDALDLTPQGFGDPTVAETYAANGLTRQRWLYALRHRHTLKALIDIQDSDLGLNLSEITNATTVYILDTEACHRDVLRFVISALAIRHSKMNHPVMFYPSSYLAHYNIASDKEYTLWALNMKTDYGQTYMEWMNRYCR